jgi:hypothetical protein
MNLQEEKVSSQLAASIAISEDFQNRGDGTMPNPAKPEPNQSIKLRMDANLRPAKIHSHPCQATRRNSLKLIPSGLVTDLGQLREKSESS